MKRDRVSRANRLTDGVGRQSSITFDGADGAASKLLIQRAEGRDRDRCRSRRGPSKENDRPVRLPYLLGSNFCARRLGFAVGKRSRYLDHRDYDERYPWRSLFLKISLLITRLKTNRFFNISSQFILADLFNIYRAVKC